MRRYILLVALFLPLTALGQIYKCVEPDGRTIFANVPCENPEGVSESVSVQVNEMGTFATPEQIRETESLRRNSTGTRARVTVVPDPKTEDLTTLDGKLNRRLRLQAEEIAQKRLENPSGVTVVPDIGRESQSDRMLRQRREAASLGIGRAPAKPKIEESFQHEINDREVPFTMNQNPLDRRIRQIENKINDPRPQDGSTIACVKKRPARGVVRVGQKEIWPGMRSSQVTLLIGHPISVNSPLVGIEQWVYRDAEGGSLYIYIKGQCVSSIQ